MEAITTIVTNIRLDLARAWRAFCRRCAAFWAARAEAAHERVLAILGRR